MGGPRKALLVDDEKFDYIGLRGLLVCAETGVQTLEWVQEWKGAADIRARGAHDIYFVDMHLGPLSGLDIISDLRADGVLAPIIALTGAGDDQIDRACSAAGASDFLVKGEFDRRALERSIRYATRSAAVHAELNRLNAALETRVAAEAEQARLMRFAVEQSADAELITKAADTLAGHVIVYANHALTSLTGHRGDELLGGSIKWLLGASLKAQVAALERVLANGLPYADDFLLSTTGEHVVSTHMRVTPLRAVAGEITHFVWNFRDVSEQLRLTEIEKQREKIEAVGQLTGSVAHDFNNLLTVIMGNLELLRLRETDGGKRTRIDNAVRAAERGAKLAHRLLAFSRPREDDIRPADVGTVLGGMSDLLMRTIGTLVRIEHSIARGTWPVLIDPDQLEVAVLNLAINARDAMPVGGTLKISSGNAPKGDPERPADLAPDLDYVFVSVSDTGAGMTPEILARVREPFFTTKPVGKGSGLGLTQVQSFVKQATGSVQILSEVDKGTVVKIYLPRAVGAKLAAKAGADPSAPVNIDGLTVLLVDDYADVREFAASALETYGCTVIQAANGQAALLHLGGKTKIDALIANFAMPQMNGVELLRRAHMERPGLPVMFITGYADAIPSETAISPEQVLAKPFKPGDLAAKVNDLINGPDSDGTKIIPFPATSRGA